MEILSDVQFTDVMRKFYFCSLITTKHRLINLLIHFGCVLGNLINIKKIIILQCINILGKCEF